MGMAQTPPEQGLPIMNKEQFMSKLIVGNATSAQELGIRFDSPKSGLDIVAGSSVHFIASAKMPGNVTKLEIVSSYEILASTANDQIDTLTPLPLHGTYSCVVRAYDDIGYTALSWPPVLVYAHGGPDETFEAHLLHPEDNATYNVLKGIPFELTVRLPDDPGKRVVNVECYLNAYTLNMPGTPYMRQLPTPDFGIGTHHISATVFLADGSQVDLKQVTVNLEEGQFRVDLKVTPQEKEFVRWSDVSYEGTAYSDAGIEQLELINQDGYVLHRVEGSGPLVFRDKLWSVGSCKLHIRATDSMGNSRESQEVSFRVIPRPGDNNGVSLRSPQNGWEYPMGWIDFLPAVSIVDTWNPTDIRVEYWEGETKLAETSGVPYAVNWYPYDDRREYRIRAKVILPDPEGDIEFESEEVHFLVK